MTRTATAVTVTVTGRAATAVPGLRLPVRVTVTGPVERPVARHLGFGITEGSSAANPSGGDAR